MPQYPRPVVMMCGQACRASPAIAPPHRPEPLAGLRGAIESYDWLTLRPQALEVGFERRDLLARANEVRRGTKSGSLVTITTRAHSRRVRILSMGTILMQYLITQLQAAE